MVTPIFTLYADFLALVLILAPNPHIANTETPPSAHIVTKICWFSQKRDRWEYGYFRTTAFSSGFSPARADRSAAYAMLGTAVFMEVEMHRSERHPADLIDWDFATHSDLWIFAHWRISLQRSANTSRIRIAPPRSRNFAGWGWGTMLFETKPLPRGRDHVYRPSRHSAFRRCWCGIRPTALDTWRPLTLTSGAIIGRMYAGRLTPPQSSRKLPPPVRHGRYFRSPLHRARAANYAAPAIRCLFRGCKFWGAGVYLSFPVYDLLSFFQ